uniref:Uncharacterized protein n=1 Tax=Panagrolaimus superbus TaxID=310955 RepID=A0A914ZH72_9BILA
MANRYPNFDILRSSTHPSTTVADSYNIESNYQKNIQLYDSQTNIIQQPSGNGFVCVGNVNLPNSNPIIDDSAEKIKQDELIYKMIDYLKNREIYDCTLLLLFPKAAFKSYTTNKEEKR